MRTTLALVFLVIQHSSNSDTSDTSGHSVFG